MMAFQSVCVFVRDPRRRRLETYMGIKEKKKEGFLLRFSSRMIGDDGGDGNVMASGRECVCV